MKNTMANNCPKGINLKTEGSVIKSKDGPAAGSKLKAKTAGIITSAAVIAANVSNITVFLAQLDTSISFLIQLMIMKRMLDLVHISKFLVVIKTPI